MLLSRHLGEDVLADVAGGGWRGRDGIMVADADELPRLRIAIARAKQRARGVAHLAVEVAADVVRLNLQTVDARLAKAVHGSVGVDISGYLERRDIGDAMDRARRANVDLITSIPDEHLDKVGKAIEDNWQAGARWESVVSRVKELGDVTANRATLIARDQTSKMNAAFNQVRQTSIGIVKYEWLDSHIGPPRERRSHQAMRGTVHYWNAPPLVDGEYVHPGEAINCMCTAIPVFDLDRAAAAGAFEYEQRRAA